MFVTVKISADLLKGTLVCHDSNNVWRQATPADPMPLGVLSRETAVDDEGVRWGEVTLAGATWARAGALIPLQGGWLASDDNGRAVISPSEDCGLIAPVSRGTTAPNEEDLILIYLR